MKRDFIQWAAALCLAGCAGLAAAAPARPHAPMGKEAYEAAKQRIAAEYQADLKLCAGVKGHARDVCKAEAEGKQDATAADLEAQYKPSPEAEQEAKNVTAEANYDVAKVKCDALKGKAEKRCMKEAKAAREAAIRQAKVEKIQETGGIFGGHASRSKSAKPGKS